MRRDYVGAVVDDAGAGYQGQGGAKDKTLQSTNQRAGGETHIYGVGV